MYGGEPYEAMSAIIVLYDFSSVAVYNVKIFFRDHPNTIKRLFTSVLCVSAVLPLVVLAWTNSMKVRVSVAC